MLMGSKYEQTNTLFILSTSSIKRYEQQIKHGLDSGSHQSDGVSSIVLRLAYPLILAGPNYSIQGIPYRYDPCGAYFCGTETMLFSFMTLH